MSDVANAILYAVQEAGLVLPEPSLVINDNSGEMRSRFPNIWNPEMEKSPREGVYKSIILFAPKQKDEVRYLIARAIRMLSKDGVVVTAATNESGGKALAKLMAEFGVSVTDISKHKCRVVWSHDLRAISAVAVEQALEKGALQKRSDGLWTQPGVFSWDRLDKGTEILLKHLPRPLSGNGADFGCGVGVIGQAVLSHNPDIKRLTCLDRDIRALEACGKNLEEFGSRMAVKQADLTKPVDLANLDFIVMNPPFHTGKTQSIALGQAFIVNAAKCLKPGGTLFFVANSHLPYEASVVESFASQRILSQEQGFKIIEARK